MDDCAVGGAVGTCSDGTASEDVTMELVEERAGRDGLGAVAWAYVLP